MFQNLIFFAFISTLPFHSCFIVKGRGRFFQQDPANNTSYSYFEIETNEIQPNRFMSPPEKSDAMPPLQEYARVARYIMHNSEWCAIATISTKSHLAGSPFANVYDVSDGATVEESTGIPYFYLTSLQPSVKDLQVNSQASIAMSMAQSDFCRKQNYDFQDPRCAHIIFNGRVVELEENSEEQQFAQRALFKRHPVMSGWPKGHDWRYLKLDISYIFVLDFYGGAKEVTPEDYFKATPY